MLWPTVLELDGASIPLSGVLADLQIHHGRSTVLDEPTATTCQIVLEPVSNAFVVGFEVGVELRVLVADGAAAPTPRFTGRVSDASLDVDRLTVIAVGRLSTLTGYPIGAVSWPAETWSARVTRCFTEAGLLAELELQADSVFNPQLAARDTLTAGETTLGDYLAFLAPMVGAAVVDRLDGRILVQAIGARTLAGRAPLDPADIAYAPVWEQVLPWANVVTVRYQADQGASVTVSDAASIALYGERPATIDTTFTSAADATMRANSALARGAFSHWNVPAAETIRGLELLIGAPLELSSLPPAAPYDPWTPILEGWSETISGDDWSMLLALSDPLASALLVPWVTVPAEWAWNEINAATAWNEALTLESLEPV